MKVTLNTIYAFAVLICLVLALIFVAIGLNGGTYVVLIISMALAGLIILTEADIWIFHDKVLFGGGEASKSQ